MHIILSKSLFQNNLNIISKAVGLKSPIPSLSGIMMHATNTQLHMYGASEDISIKSTLDNNLENLNLTIIKEGSILIDCEYINKVVSTSDSDMIEIELIDSSLIKVSGLNSEFKINSMNVDNYPTINFLDENNKYFNIKKKLFDEIIEDTAFAASEEKTKPGLTGIQFKCENNTLKCVATDSYRLAKKLVTLEECEDFNFIIPANNLKRFHNVNSNSENLKIIYNHNSIQLNIENYYIRINLIDDQYPDTDRLIPTQYINQLEIDPKILSKTIERATFVANNKKSTIKINVTNDGVLVKSNSQEIGSYEELIKYDSFEGEPIEISFNGTYLKEALRTLNKNSCILKFNGQLKPFILIEKDNDELLHLLVPVRTYY